MSLALEILAACGGVGLGMIGLFLLLVSAAAWFPRRLQGAGEPALSVVVIVPAHNEEDQIQTVVRSVLENDYPPKQRGVLVIADNCTDRTAERARKAGAVVLERCDPENPGKGQALDWCLRSEKERLERFDGIAIVDADSLVDPAFLGEVACALSEASVQVVQGFHGVLNPKENWRTALTFAGFAGVNHVRPAGLDRLGGSAGLKGNGMAFRSRLLLERGWPAHSVVEDMELANQLLGEGIQVRYNGDAVVLSEMPALARQATSQRRRWEGGRYQLFCAQAPILLKLGLKRLSLAPFGAMLDLLVPPLSLLGLLLAAYAVLAAWIGDPIWLALALANIAAALVYLGTGLIQRRAPWAVWRALLLAPLFAFWKVPIYIGLLFRREHSWVRTTRKTELERSHEE